MISVCMATYNGEKYISDQIASILGQLESCDELIIVDDCSSDSTIEIIESFLDPRIKIHVNETNIGVIRSFSRAIEASEGEYIFLSDQDDVWMPNKVRISLLELKKGFNLVVSDAYILQNDTIALSTFFEIRKSGPGILKNYFKNTFIGCCIAFDRVHLDKILPFPDGVSMHDFWIGEIISIYGKVSFLPDRLIVYRRHENNVTALSSGSVTSIIRKRYIDFKYTSARIFRVGLAKYA
ncbi:alpha-L-Rha alpha-1,3-L-rhamnosyltransferase [Deinococcus daejeonensis]|uniref:Alpha-L-Rha alpha-1,3-L-rhamnosyltransferase n=2 Tax=Deinococcus daejeonensis TaxID=1007098 RepID=A0ABQ2J2N4_9DEIO|nr:alpha-L-Rha alpha-1,3-L-rhamnosyltransferase [Deinococcus daejeonensis]